MSGGYKFAFIVATLLLYQVFASSPTSKNPFTHELTGVSGFGARSLKKTIFPTSLSLNNVTSDSSPVKKNRTLGKIEVNYSVLKTETPTRLWARKTKDPDALWIQVKDEEGSAESTIRLSVDEATGDWQAEERDEEGAVAESEWIPIEGIYGMYRVPSGIIWVLVSKTEAVYSAPPMENKDSWWTIRRVVNLELVHLSRPKLLLTTLHLKEEIRQLRLLREALKYHNLYFVPTSSDLVTDMTKNLQESLGKGIEEFKQQWWEGEEHGQRPDPRFFWNLVAAEPLLQKFNTSEAHSQDQNTTATLLKNLLPLTSAFVGVQQNQTVGDGSEMMYDEILISRRSKYRTGTRFTRRGADASGSVANFAETEQISLVFSNETYKLMQAMSHIQTRGSIPLRWSSPADVKTYRPRIRIGMDPLAHARALRLHLLEQGAYYGRPLGSEETSTEAEIIFVNLIDKHSDQGRLGRAFDAVLKAVMEVHSNQTDTPSAVEEVTNTSMSDKYPGPSVEHIWYDFHAEVKGGKWHKLGNLLKDLQPPLLDHGFFQADFSPNATGSMEVKRRQIGAVRTNCMDCLDRTNVVQSMIGRFMLFQQLSTASTGFMKEKAEKKKWADHALKFRKNELTLPWSEGEVAHRLLWADNADAISRLYAGTPALKGDFTRTGKRTKKGALDDGMNSLQRYYLNNFLDADRQEGMDLLVGYANFSNAEFLEDDIGGDDEASLSEAGDKKALFSIQEAARQTFFGGILDGLNGQEQGDVKQRLSDIGIRGGTRVSSRNLDLRWLPGDLQNHVISQADVQASATRKRSKVDEKSEFCSTEALEAIDRRSASFFPWWAVLDDETDSDSDEGTESEGDKKSTNNATKDVESKSTRSVRLLSQHQREHRPVTPMQLLGVVIVAAQAPMSLAGVVVALLTLTFLPDVIGP